MAAAQTNITEEDARLRKKDCARIRKTTRTSSGWRRMSDGWVME